MTENQQNKNLQEYREQIDAIDKKIIELLQSRLKIVRQVGALKHNYQNKFYIHSNRESDMIKNLIKYADNQIPTAAIISIWRKIISTANIIEQNLKIALHNPKNINEYYALVRDYYNNEIPIINFDSANKIVSELENNHCQIGIFALPNSFDETEKKEDAKENWWIALANNQVGMRVFTKIPFSESSTKENNSHQLLAVAIKEAEPSQSDKTLVCIESPAQFNKLSIINFFKENNLEIKILKSTQIIQFDGIKFFLGELDGFYNDNNQIFAKLSSKSSAQLKPFIKILGHFPTAIVV